MKNMDNLALIKLLDKLTEKQFSIKTEDNDISFVTVCKSASEAEILTSKLNKLKEKGVLSYKKELTQYTSRYIITNCNIELLQQAKIEDTIDSTNRWLERARSTRAMYQTIPTTNSPLHNKKRHNSEPLPSQSDDTEKSSGKCNTM